MRRGRLRLRHPPGDRRLELRELLVGRPGPWRSRARGRREPPARRGLRRGGVASRPRAAGPATRGRPAAEAALSTSALTIRPPGPDPEAAAGRGRSLSRCAWRAATPSAARRLSPEASARPGPSASAAGSALSQPPLRGWRGCGGARGRFAARRRPSGRDRTRGRRSDPSPESPTRAIGVPIGSVSPSCGEDLGQRPGHVASRRPCSPCRSRSRPARRRPRPRRRPASATAGSSPPPSSPRAAASRPRPSDRLPPASPAPP